MPGSETMDWVTDEPARAPARPCQLRGGDAPWPRRIVHVHRES